MKIKMLKREFPLVAVVLLVSAVLILLVAIDGTAKTTREIRSDKSIGFIDDQSIPWEITNIEPIQYRIGDIRGLKYSGKPVEIPESALGQRQVGAIRVNIGDTPYMIDYNAYQEPITKGRTALILLTNVPYLIKLYGLVALAIFAATALLKSYKLGYLHKSNLLLIKISTATIAVVLISPIISRFAIRNGIFGPYSYQLDWSYEVKQTFIPVLLILAVVIGLTNAICSNMRNGIALKEEIDGTV